MKDKDQPGISRTFNGPLWHIIGTFRFRFRRHMYGLRVIRQCSPNLSQRLWAKLSEMPLLALDVHQTGVAVGDGLC
jgi:hypothetical protein